MRLCVCVGTTMTVWSQCANYHTHLVCSFQLSVVASRDSLDNLHEQLCALDNAGDHGPEPEWVGSHLRIRIRGWRKMTGRLTVV